LEYFHCLVKIEYFRLNIEYLRNSFHFKKDGAKRHPQIFNLQYSIFNPGLSGLGDSFYYVMGHIVKVANKRLLKTIGFAIRLPIPEELEPKAKYNHEDHEDHEEHKE